MQTDQDASIRDTLPFILANQQDHRVGLRSNTIGPSISKRRISRNLRGLTLAEYQNSNIQHRTIVAAWDPLRNMGTAE